LLAHRFGFGMSFVGLAAVACVAWLLLWLAVPETLNHEGQTRTSRA